MTKFEFKRLVFALCVGLGVGCFLAGYHLGAKIKTAPVSMHMPNFNGAKYIEFPKDVGNMEELELLQAVRITPDSIVFHYADVIYNPKFGDIKIETYK